MHSIWENTFPLAASSGSISLLLARLPWLWKIQNSVEHTWAMTDDGLWATSSPPSVFESRVLLEHLHAHSFLYCPWLLLCYHGKAEQLWQRPYGVSAKPKILANWPVAKKKKVYQLLVWTTVKWRWNSQCLITFSRNILTKAAVSMRNRAEVNLEEARLYQGKTEYSV